MRDVEPGTIRKLGTATRNLTPEQECVLRATEATDFLFESLIQGHSFSGDQELVDKHARIFFTAVQEEIIDLDEFREAIEARVEQTSLNSNRSSDVTHHVDSILESLRMPREDLPLFINDKILTVRAIATARIKYGED